MPQTAGQEPLPISPHALDRWYRNSTGATFRMKEQPQRLFQARMTDGSLEPERYYGTVELVSGVETSLLWRYDTTELLTWWTVFLPRWIVALLFPLPDLAPAQPRADRGLIHEGAPSVPMSEILLKSLEEAKEAELLLEGTRP
jgi:hypothetical protein